MTGEDYGQLLQSYVLLSPIHTSNNVGATFNFVAKNGNIVEATGNKVACCFDNIASTLLLVWTGLYTRTGHSKTNTAVDGISENVT